MNPEAKRRDLVLVVDDTPDSLSFLTDALEASGATVLVALDGDSCLALVQEITPDLVLMDAIMPGMDGFETCRRLKRLKQMAGVPVIFMTGLSESEHVVNGLEAGGVDYVTKPIRTDELLARMRVHLANARQAHSAKLALDVAGRFLLATDRAGHLRWSTSQAASLLATLFADFDARSFILPPPLVRWLAGLAGGVSTTAHCPWLVEGRRLDFAYLSQTGPDEFLLRLTDADGRDEAARLKQALPLTAREAEVLSWIARGKSNRDMSDILGISPRTVNKHLEQIFTKLGVENRASAAAAAVRVLDRDG
jgi:DNA-binding response OmpR family regulator/DNA-binding CsgD family transcriptional regulator